SRIVSGISRTEIRTWAFAPPFSKKCRRYAIKKWSDHNQMTDLSNCVQINLFRNENLAQNFRDDRNRYRLGVITASSPKTMVPLRIHYLLIERVWNFVLA